MPNTIRNKSGIKYRAQVTNDRLSYYIGHFDTYEQAKQAEDQLRRKLNPTLKWCHKKEKV